MSCRRQGPGVRDEKGVALIIVLLMLSLLLMVVGEFAPAMRLEATTALNFRAAVAGTYLAEAAYYRAVAEILPDGTFQQIDERAPGLPPGPHRVPEGATRLDIPLGSGGSRTGSRTRGPAQPEPDRAAGPPPAAGGAGVSEPPAT
jgi:hypothetical protein